MKVSRTDVINVIAEKINAQYYLEIGVRDPDDNFNKVNVPYKIGVDPSARKRFIGEIAVTSDAFFALNAVKFDLIFIDGLHRYEQCIKDILNSLDSLTEKGIIVVHDCNPPDERHQKANKCGTCWMAVAELRMTRPDLWIATVPNDFGCSIIKRGKQSLYPKAELTWDLFADNKNELMNFISFNQLEGMIF